MICDSTYRLCLRLLDTVQTETNKIRDNQIQRERNQKTEAVYTEFIVSAGEAGRGEKKRERGVVL